MLKSRIFLFLLLAFISGIAWRSFFEIPYFLLWVGVLFASFTIAAGILRKNKTLIVYGVLFFAFGIGIVRFDQVINQRPDLSSFYGKSFIIQGIVIAEPELTEKVQRLKILIESVNNHPVKKPSFTPLFGGQRAGFTVLLTIRKYPLYRLGDEFRIEGVLESPKNYSDFDYVSYLARQDIFAVMSFPVIEKIAEGRGNKLKLFLSKIKFAFEENIDRVLQEPHAAFLKGILLGESESFPPELVESFARTGTTHIIALSGYNITIVGGSFMALLLFFTVPFQISFWIALATIVLFILMVGASPSVTRAGILGILVLIAGHEGRLYSIRNALAFAGAVMVFHNPFIFRFGSAFQLSFLATLGLVYLAPHVEKFLEKLWFKIRGFWGQKSTLGLRKIHNRPHDMSFSEEQGTKLKQILIETLSAQIMVLPLLIYLFGRVSLISPFANMLVLMAVPYVMAFGFLTGLFGFFSEILSQIMGYITWVLLDYELHVIKFFAGLLLSSVTVGKWFLVPVGFFYLFIFWKLWRNKN